MVPGNSVTGFLIACITLGLFDESFDITILRKWRSVVQGNGFSNTLCLLMLFLDATKDHLIWKRLFGVLNSSIKRTKNFCHSRLRQKSKFSSWFFGRLKTPKCPFEINWPLLDQSTYKLHWNGEFRSHTCITNGFLEEV